MVLFESDWLEPQILGDLIDDINTHYELCEKTLIALDTEPDDKVLIGQLFRSVHTIKGNLGIVGVTPLLPLLSALEDLLELLRQGSMTHNALLGDLVLLVLDDVQAFFRDYQRDGTVEYDDEYIVALVQQLKAIAPLPDPHRPARIAEVIRFLDPSVSVAPEESDQSRQQATDFFAELADESRADLIFFRQLMDSVEARSHFWLGRSDRILKMALLLNRLAGKPVDEGNLAIAVYVHDFGMAFVPMALLHKKSVLSDSEIIVMRSHVQSSAQLLQHMPHWQEAKKIVMQHHEAVNGAGYPCGLRESQICDGAKILAIADSFDALTHQRAYSADQKRPIIRAVSEINDCAGKQLSPRWVAVFNQAVESVMKAHRNKTA